MRDIVERLRDTIGPWVTPLTVDAADEIERLREENAMLRAENELLPQEAAAQDAVICEQGLVIAELTEEKAKLREVNEAQAEQIAGKNAEIEHLASIVRRAQERIRVSENAEQLAISVRRSQQIARSGE